MYKLWATIKKDYRLLVRDRAGLLSMFAMPIILAIVITSVQNSTFELVNDNKVALLIYNKDSGTASSELIVAIEKMGMFRLSTLSGNEGEEQIKNSMHEKDAMVAILVPPDFSDKIARQASRIAEQALKGLDLPSQAVLSGDSSLDPVTLYYHPVLQPSFRESIRGALNNVLQLVESKAIVNNLYSRLHEKKIPDSLENQIVNNQVPIKEIPVSRDGNRTAPNATQHNVPAWTVFAMFFIVISLGSSVVREKLNGSFLRLKTLPTHFMIALLSKQIVYISVTLLQAVVIFSLGVWFFPHIGLPGLHIPSDLIGLFLVTLVCGWCAASFAICIGVFAQTQEQANGFGTVFIVILAAIGGLLVPSFAMPSSFKLLMKMSPLHWCLESYYGLFLEGGKLKDIMLNILSLLGITIFMQAITLLGLTRKNLI
jgi:ABC-2 type transport system permease protein